MISHRLQTVLLVLVAALAAHIAAWGQCSNATLKGNAAFIVSGLDTNGAPVAAFGHIKSNGKGTFTGVETVADNGAILDNAPITGTYKVHSDCTGTSTTMIENLTSNAVLVVLSSGTGFQILNVDSPNIQQGSAQAQGDATCTAAGLNGNFGIQAGGTIIGVGDVVLTGLINFNGAGKLKGTESGSVAGEIFTGQSVSGSYKVKSNCTGTATIKIKGFTPLHANLAITNGGKGVMVVATDAGTVISGIGQQ